MLYSIRWRKIKFKYSLDLGCCAHQNLQVESYIYVVVQCHNASEGVRVPSPGLLMYIGQELERFRVLPAFQESLGWLDVLDLLHLLFPDIVAPAP
jgi:hypothetical protein